MKPIIFSTDMVRANQEGRKHQARRAIKPPPHQSSLTHGQTWLWNGPGKNGIPQGQWLAYCPYQVGDQLWVRETWAPTYQGSDCLYKADDWTGPFPFTGKWKPAISMPRWASRITIEVTGHGGGNPRPHSWKGIKSEWPEIMGMPWATPDEVTQSIPPVYSEYLGKYMMEVLDNAPLLP